MRHRTSVSQMELTQRRSITEPKRERYNLLHPVLGMLTEVMEEGRDGIVLIFLKAPPPRMAKFGQKSK